MALTDALVRSAKSGSKTIKLSDGGGLQLRIEPNGSKRFVLAYRWQGKQKEFAFGVYPQISLKDARARRDEIKVALRAGQNPAELKPNGRGRHSSEPSFASVAEDVFERNRLSGLAEVTVTRKQWVLAHHLKSFAERSVSTIEAKDVLDLVQSIERQGTIETAHRARMLISEVMRLAVVKGLAKYDPTPALRGVIVPRKIVNRSRITKPERFGELLRAIDDYKGHWQVRAGLKLLSMLAVRPGELRGAQWSEFDLESAVWTVPASRMKMAQEHRVPLPDQALTILHDVKVITGGVGLVLPGVTIRQRPLSENTFNQAIRRCGFSAAEHCAHGFRGSFSTLANESGLWNFDVIEAQLAHQERNAVRRAYNHARYWEERLRLTQWLADECDRLSG